MTFKPSAEILNATYQKNTDNKIGKRINALTRDFAESIEQMPLYKGILKNLGKSGEKVQQEMIDMIYIFYIAGISTVLDKTTHFNKEKKWRGSVQ